MNLVAYVSVGLLYFKARFKPSLGDHGTSGHFITDFYYGTELYPRVCGVDVKMFVNCRFGMMGWGILIISFLAGQYQRFNHVSDGMCVSVALQLIYITKFYYWESGYMNTIDIVHDYAGYYTQWGCLVFISILYTSGAQYLSTNFIHLGWPLSITIFCLGIIAISINYDCDRQRKTFRAKKGEEKIWGKEAQFIRAKYMTSKGEERESLLLHSGYWGISRHFHYIPEVLAAICWHISALNSGVSAYSYVLFLIPLLTHRAFRDDSKCKEKYGKYWDEYCKKVPNKIIPQLIR